MYARLATRTTYALLRSNHLRNIAPVALRSSSTASTATSSRSSLRTPSSYGYASLPEWAAQGSITYVELKPLTESTSSDILLLDVRSPAEVAEGIIPRAINVPLSQLEEILATESNEEAKFGERRVKKDDRIVVYCRRGERGRRAMEMLQKSGWTNVRNYVGSWLNWTQQERRAKY